MRLNKAIAIAFPSTCWAAATLADDAPPLRQLASEVIDCMRTNIPRTLQACEVELEARNDIGTQRAIKGRLHMKREADGANGKDAARYSESPRPIISRAVPL